MAPICVEVYLLFFFSIKTREFESVETCPRFARESSIGTLYSIHDFENKMSNDESLQLNLAFSQKNPKLQEKGLQFY